MTTQNEVYKLLFEVCRDAPYIKRFIKNSHDVDCDWRNLIADFNVDKITEPHQLHVIEKKILPFMITAKLANETIYRRYLKSLRYNYEGSLNINYLTGYHNNMLFDYKGKLPWYDNSWQALLNLLQEMQNLEGIEMRWE